MTKNKGKIPPKMWGKKEVENYLKISQKGVERLMQKRAIKFYRIGKVVRFKRYDVEEFLRKNCITQKQKKVLGETPKK